jgi:hypothetical protein
MHPAQGAFSRVVRNAALLQDGLQAMLLEFVPAPGAGKEAPIIRHPVDPNFKDPRYYGFIECHVDWRKNLRLSLHRQNLVGTDEQYDFPC